MSEIIGKKQELFQEIISPELYRQLDLLHRDGVYIGAHGGGITHPLTPSSDIDLAIIPPHAEQIPEVVDILLSSIPEAYNLPFLDENQILSLVESYMGNFDYFSLKLRSDYGHPLSLHIHNPDFRRSYHDKDYAVELRIPPKKTGISIYEDTAISPEGERYPVYVSTPQTPVSGAEAVLNFIHTCGVYPVYADRTNTKLLPRIYSPTSEYPALPPNLFLPGLETSKILSEIPLFDGANTSHLIVAKGSVRKLADFCNISFDQALEICSQAYHGTFARRKPGRQMDTTYLHSVLNRLRNGLENHEGS